MKKNEKNKPKNKEGVDLIPANLDLSAIEAREKF